MKASSAAATATSTGSTSRPAINMPHQFRLGLSYQLLADDQVLFAGRIEGRRGRRDDFQPIKPIGFIRQDEILLHRLVSDFARYGLLPTGDELFRAFAPSWGHRLALNPEIWRKDLAVGFKSLIEVGPQNEPIVLVGAQMWIEIGHTGLILEERGQSMGLVATYPLHVFERSHSKDFRADANAFFDDLQARLIGL